MATADFLKRQYEQYQAAIDQYNQQLRSYQPKADVYNQKVGIYNAAQRAMGFDEDYYLKQNPDVAASGMGAWQHFALHGFKEGRKPNAYASDVGRGTSREALGFNAEQYNAATGNRFGYSTPTDEYGNAIGDAQFMGLSDWDRDELWKQYANANFPNAPARSTQNTSTAAYFDPDWYKKKYGIAEDVNPYEHYQQNKSTGTYKPNQKAQAGVDVYSPEFFNPTEYLRANPDVAASGQDPWEHFIYHGAKEKRWRSTGMDVEKPGEAPEFKGVQPKDPGFTPGQMAAAQAPTPSLASEESGLIQSALKRAPTSISGLLAGLRRST